jgi:hypothetical protein
MLPAASDQMLDAALPCAAGSNAEQSHLPVQPAMMRTSCGCRNLVQGQLLEHCHAQGQLSNVTPVDLSRKEQQKES